MIATYKENNNPIPYINEIAGAFVIRFFKSEGVSEGVNEGVSEGVNLLIDYIKENPGQRISQITKNIAIPTKTLERWVKILKLKAVIEYRGSSKTGGYYSKYRLVCIINE